MFIAHHSSRITNDKALTKQHNEEGAMQSCKLNDKEMKMNYNMLSSMKKQHTE